MNLRKKPRGLMIVDAIIGMFLLTIVFGVVISTMVMGIQSGRQSREFQYAGLAARQVVENIRSFKKAAVADGMYQDATILGAVPQLSILSNASVSAHVSSFNTRAHQVVVTVSWYSVPARRNRVEKFTTLFSSDGVAK
ncbi:hypothetical protein [Armatimonas sp.]|uniref:hypothetical protein n=1 Tax=Armatimonas sp. TaxID=1872638 RepID=UPI00374CD6D2